MVGFGPDGFLYIARGDGGAGGDPGNRAQNRQELLGKILRIDVDQGTPYAIPADNPFAAGGGRSEMFPCGFRSPRRVFFDRTTAELWAAALGQGGRERTARVARGANSRVRGLW